MTVYSTMRCSPEDIHLMDQKKAKLGIPPAIEFWPLKPKKDHEESTDVLKQKKETYVLITIPFRTQVKDSPSYERHIKIFKGGTPEEYCQHRQSVDEVIDKLALKQYTRAEGGIFRDCYGTEIDKDECEDEAACKCHALFLSTLGGNALRVYQKAHQTYTSATEKDDEDSESLFLQPVTSPSRSTQ